MDERTKDLLAQTAEACIERDLVLEVGADFNHAPEVGVVYAGTRNEHDDRNGWSKRSLGGALDALLRDIKRST